MQHDDAGEFLADTPDHGSGVPSALPGSRWRPLTRRRHARVPGTTAADVERHAWGGTVEAEPALGAPAAVSVVPGARRRSRALLRPAPAGADLQELLGDEELGCRPGRHRQDRRAWQLLRHVPGWRPSPPAWDVDGDDPVDAASDAGTDADADAAVDTEPTSDVRPDVAAEVSADPAREAQTVPIVTDGAPGPDVPGEALPAVAASEPSDAPVAEPQARVRGPLEEEIAAAADLPVPAQRDAASEPWYRQRRRRSPAPSLRAELQAAGRRLQEADGQGEIATAAAQEAARLVDAEVAALVLRAVEGPRVLSLHPGGLDAPGLWGPATLAALLGVGHPVRRVVEGDPLADGGATALLAVPVPSGGAIAGTLLARRHEPRAFSPVEQDVLSRLARMTGAALLAAARRTAFERGELDEVTRLPGGRRLTGDVAAAVRTADRAGMPVSVVAAHVQGLARLRTELGASAADDFLGMLARALGGVLRVGDVAYRIGEDELALLLPATDGAGLPTLCERLEAVTAEVTDRLSLPGGPRDIALRTAVVPLDAVRAGADVVDAATRALEIDRQKVRWTRNAGAVSA